MQRGKKNPTVHWFPFWEIRQGARDILAERKTRLSPKGNNWDVHGVRVTQPRQALIDFPSSQGGLSVPNASIPFSSSPSPAKASGNSRNDEWCYCWDFNWWEKPYSFFFFFFLVFSYKHHQQEKKLK